jgi:hypothetical protein
MMLNRMWLSVIALTCFGGFASAADSVSQDASPAIAPAVQTALTELLSDDFNTRSKALEHLQAAFAQEAVLLASERSPEVRADLSKALEFQDGLIRWVVSVLKMPAEGRAAELQLISNPKALPTLSKIFSARSSLRVEGIQALATPDLSEASPMGVDLLLAHLVDDDDRAVSLAAMEVIWERKPSAPVVNVLWRRAVEEGMNRSLQSAVALQHRKQLTFLGRPVQNSAGFFTSPGQPGANDSDIATEVLAHLQSPLVKEKLIAFFRQAAEMSARADVTNTQLYAYSTMPSARNAYALLEAYKPLEVIPSLYRLATSRAAPPQSYSDRAGRYVATNRTSAIAALTMLTGQRSEDYQLKLLDRRAGGVMSGAAGSMWVVPTEGDDVAAVTKLQDWWIQNGTRYGGQSKAQ